MDSFYHPLEKHCEELEIKVEHHRKHATFLDLDITIENCVFVYKLPDRRDKFQFFLLFTCPFLLFSNVLSSIFYHRVS